MGWTARIGIAVVVILILGAVGLAIYGSTLKPPHRVYEEVVPNERLQG